MSAMLFRSRTVKWDRLQSVPVRQLAPMKRFLLKTSIKIHVSYRRKTPRCVATPPEIYIQLWSANSSLQRMIRIGWFWDEMKPMLLRWCLILRQIHRGIMAQCAVRYALSSHFTVFCFVLILGKITYIPQGYFTSTGWSYHCPNSS